MSIFLAAILVFICNVLFTMTNRIRYFFCKFQPNCWIAKTATKKSITKSHLILSLDHLFICSNLVINVMFIGRDIKTILITQRIKLVPHNTWRWVPTQPDWTIVCEIPRLVVIELFAVQTPIVVRANLEPFVSSPWWIAQKLYRKNH